MGIEPTSLAWEAGILPMNYARTSLTHIFYHYSVKIARAARREYSREQDDFSCVGRSFRV